MEDHHSRHRERGSSPTNVASQPIIVIRTLYPRSTLLACFPVYNIDHASTVALGLSLVPHDQPFISSPIPPSELMLRSLIQVLSGDICPSVSDLFHLA